MDQVVLETLLRKSPRARIAVVGASNNPEKYGNIIVRNLVGKGYAVFPVNPKEPAIAGIPAAHSLAEVEPKPDDRRDGGAASGDAPRDEGSRQAGAPDLVLLLLLCVMLGDTGAYYTGRAFGRHPMAPTISPKKTWEGAAGALLGSLAAATLAHYWFFQRLSVAHAATLAGILCVVGVFGDLAESMIKRAGGVKDSSSLLPGHGGIFDRLDSLLFAAPVLYYYYRVFLLGSS